MLGVDCDNGSEFINPHRLRWCQDPQKTLRAMVAGKNITRHGKQNAVYLSQARIR